jgi:hypothetical protein
MPLSQPGIDAVFAQETDEAFVVLLTVAHAAIDPPVRVCLNGAQIVSNGNTFVPYPFDIRLPRRNGKEMPTVTLRIDNVDRSIVAALRAIDSPATVTVEVVLADSPDVREAGPYVMTLRSARTPNPAEIFGELAYEDVLNEAWPAPTFTPNNFPGLF